jgi:hypothetical protein
MNFIRVLNLLTALGAYDTNPCTTGSPTINNGYTITYVQATPTVSSLPSDAGYRPNSLWADSHALNTFVGLSSGDFFLASSWPHEL